MTLTLLLDLDDTLLNTNLSAFVPAYFQALVKHLDSKVQPQKMRAALMSGMGLMTRNEDPSLTLQEVFEESFYDQLGIRKEELINELEYFYDEIFPCLRHVTSQIPEAAPFLEWARAQKYRLVIATDPLFPRKATHHRLRWAGFDPGQFELISSFEEFHFSKTHASYYAELLGRIGWPDGPVLMVGNDLERDIIPAQKLGLATFYVNGNSASGSGSEMGAGGKLSDLRPWLESTDPTTLTPAFKHSESVIGILSASPASLAGLSANLDTDAWLHEPDPGNWAPTEIICHLRDTEREIHHMQIKMLREQTEPFLPRPDTSVWASQRNYLDENGPAALKEFNAARRETIAMLENVDAEELARKARHAIFGPTDFLEILGFMADHDRMHIQQTWKVINNKN